MIYASLLTALLPAPIGAKHIRRGYLREFGQLSPRRTIADIAANVATFVPFGWGFHRAIRRFRFFEKNKSIIVVTLMTALFSLIIETVQYFMPTRYSSGIDVAPRHFDVFLGAKTLVLNPRLIFLVQQVERQRLAAFDRRVEAYRDGDEAEADGALPDWPRHAGFRGQRRCQR
jgi:VanZ family protein